ncbi:rod shape-determining protein RodA [Bacillus sp. SRB_336]|nr:rod shape-determining protein RodA [Bacillus sp. SRB_336]
MKRILLALVLTGLIGAALAANAGLPITPAPGGAEVYIISPVNGATVGQEVTVRFGLKGMGVAPAGVSKERTGHHHLLVDVKELPAAGQPISNDANHIHFGGGQTETTLKLAPGTHTLQLELGDQNHVPFEPALVSKKITIDVK